MGQPDLRTVGGLQNDKIPFWFLASRIEAVDRLGHLRVERGDDL